jgi:hypothetical protein
MRPPSPDYDDDAEVATSPATMLATAREKPNMGAFPTRKSATDMMMALDGDQLDSIAAGNHAGSRSASSLSALSSSSSFQQANKPMVLKAIVVSPDSDSSSSFVNDLRVQAGTAWSRQENDEDGKPGRPLRVVLGVGAGAHVHLVAKIVNKCRAFGCVVKVLIGRGADPFISSAVTADALGWAAVGSACERTRDTRGRGRAAVQFFDVSDDEQQQQQHVGAASSSSSSVTAAGATGARVEGLAAVTPPLHCVLSDWADAMLVVPLDAAALADVSAGHPGNPGGEGQGGCLIPRVLRCWDPAKDAILVPGLNRHEKRNPATDRQLALLRSQELFPYVRVLEVNDTDGHREGGGEGGGGDEGSPPKTASAQADTLVSALIASARRHRSSECGDEAGEYGNDDDDELGYDERGKGGQAGGNEDGIRRRKW